MVPVGILKENMIEENIRAIFYNNSSCYFPLEFRDREFSSYALKQFPGPAYLTPNQHQLLHSSNFSLGVKSLHRTAIEVTQNIKM